MISTAITRAVVLHILAPVVARARLDCTIRRAKRGPTC